MVGILPNYSEVNMEILFAGFMSLITMGPIFGVIIYLLEKKRRNFKKRIEEGYEKERAESLAEEKREKADRIERANIKEALVRKLRKGMLFQEVRDIFGAPSEIKKSEENEIWLYQQDTIIFETERVKAYDFRISTEPEKRKSGSVFFK